MSSTPESMIESWSSLWEGDYGHAVRTISERTGLSHEGVLLLFIANTKPQMSKEMLERMLNAMEKQIEEVEGKDWREGWNL